MYNIQIDRGNLLKAKHWQLQELPMTERMEPDLDQIKTDLYHDEEIIFNGIDRKKLPEATVSIIHINPQDRFDWRIINSFQLRNHLNYNA